MKKDFEFTGYRSGDCECFCFDVTLEDFIKIRGEKPAKFDESAYYKGFYRIYPTDLIMKLYHTHRDYLDGRGPNKFKISIEIEE